MNTLFVTSLWFRFVLTTGFKFKNHFETVQSQNVTRDIEIKLLFLTHQIILYTVYYLKNLKLSSH